MPDKEPNNINIKKSFFLKMFLKQDCLLYLSITPMVIIFMINIFDFASKNLLMFFAFAFLSVFMMLLIGLLIKLIYTSPINKFISNYDDYKNDLKFMELVKKKAYRLPYIDGISIFFRGFFITAFCFSLTSYLFLGATIYDIIMISVLFFTLSLICMPIHFFIAENDLIKIHEIKALKHISYIDLGIKALKTRGKIIISLVLSVLFPTILLVTIIMFSANDILDLKNVLTVIIVFLLSCVSLSTLCGYLLSKNLKISINNVNEILKQLANFNGDLTIQLPCTTSDDIGSLSKFFNDFLLSLNKMIGTIKASIVEINEGLFQLTNSMNTLSDGTVSQASSMEEITSSSEEISSRIRHTTDSIEQAYQLVNETKKKSISSSIQTEKSINVLNRSNTDITELVNVIEKLNNYSNDIQNIIKLIDDIAFQTNILALNADIEAARVGKYGKGFAVVANSVRVLASRSSKAVEETANKIKEIIKVIQNSSEMVDKTSINLKDISNTTNVVVKTFLDVNDNIAKLEKLMNEIQLNSHEEANGLDNINNGLNQIESVVQENSASTEQTASITQNLSNQTNIVSQYVSKFIVSDKSSEDTEIKAIVEKKS